MDRTVDVLLKKLLDAKGSDLFISTNNYPAMRVDGEVTFISEIPVKRDITHKMYEEMTGMTPEEHMGRRTELDMAYSSAGVGRFRVNVFYQHGELGFVFRHIPTRIPIMDDLGLPIEVIRKLAAMKRGLVLVTGITGSGKSTTLASMVEYINMNHSRHIVTIEDPVEFIYERKKSLVNQRELGRDTPDFPTALRAVVRQSPDVILIGEMRDMETVEAALAAAETGHLVLSSLHTLNAIQTVERVLAFFPPHQHSLIRLQMALVLEGVISQRLIKRADGKGRVPCVEIMMATPTVKELLEQGKTRSLDKAVKEGGHFHCQTFNQSLNSLASKEIITQEIALTYSDNPDELKMLFRGITQGKGKDIGAGSSANLQPLSTGSTGTLGSTGTMPKLARTDRNSLSPSEKSSPLSSTASLQQRQTLGSAPLRNTETRQNAPEKKNLPNTGEDIIFEKK